MGEQSINTNIELQYITMISWWILIATYSNPISIKRCVGYSTMSHILNVIEPLQEKWWHRSILYQYHVQPERKKRFIADVGTINLQISSRIIKMRLLETYMVIDSYYAYVMWTNLQLLSHVMYLSLLLSTNYSTFINHLLIVRRWTM